MAESQPLPDEPCGAEYLRAVLRSPVYEVAQVTPLQKMEKNTTSTIKVPNASDCCAWRFMKPTMPREGFSAIAVWMTVVVDGPGVVGVLTLRPPHRSQTS